MGTQREHTHQGEGAQRSDKENDVKKRISHPTSRERKQVQTCQKPGPGDSFLYCSAGRKGGRK